MKLVLFHLYYIYLILIKRTPLRFWNFFFLFLGLGGGYNERENVEYIEREESDGEYDEVFC